MRFLSIIILGVLIMSCSTSKEITFNTRNLASRSFYFERYSHFKDCQVRDKQFDNLIMIKKAESLYGRKFFEVSDRDNEILDLILEAARDPAKAPSEIALSIESEDVLISSFRKTSIYSNARGFEIAMHGESEGNMINHKCRELINYR